MVLTGFRLILLICLFVSTALWVVVHQSALREPSALAAVTAPALESATEKAPGQIQAIAIDAVRQTSADMPLNGNAGGPQNTAGLAERLDGNDVVAIAVNEQDGGLGRNVSGQMLGAGEEAGKTDNAGDGPRAAKTHVKRHHGALAKPNKRKRTVRKAKRSKLVIQKRIKPRRRVADTAPAFFRVSEG